LADALAAGFFFLDFDLAMSKTSLGIAVGLTRIAAQDVQECAFCDTSASPLKIFQVPLDVAGTLEALQDQRIF